MPCATSICTPCPTGPWTIPTRRVASRDQMLGTSSGTLDLQTIHGSELCYVPPSDLSGTGVQTRYAHNTLIIGPKRYPAKYLQKQSVQTSYLQQFGYRRTCI